MLVKRHLRFQPQRVARAEPAGNNSKFAACFNDGSPHRLARRNIARNINLKPIFARVTSAGNQPIRQSADRSLREPVILDWRKICICQLLQNVYRARPLNRQLSVRVAQVFDHAVKRGRILANPLNVLLARSGINHQQKIVIAQAMHNHVVYKSALRVEHRGVLRLPNRQFRCVIHAEILNRGERAARSFSGVNADVAHVADVEHPNASAHRLVFRHQAAARRILDRHIPAAEIHHFRAKLPVQRIQRRLAKFSLGRRCDGVHPTRSGRKSW